MPDNKLGVAPTPPVPVGAQQYNDFQAAGVPADQLAAWKSQQSNDLLAAGALPKDVDAYWGDQPAAAPASAKAFNANLQSNAPTKKSDNLLENLAAGWDISVGGLILSGKAPAKNVQPQGLAATIAHGAGQLSGDIIPAVAGFFGGGVAGGVAGAAIPGAGETGVPEVVGAVAGAGFGSGAVPEAMRQTLIDAYRRGEVHTFKEWTQVIGSGTASTLKQGVAGAIGNLTGHGLGKVVAAPIAGKFAGGVVEATTNAAASTAALGAMNGRMPDADDFTAGMILALGATAAGHMSGGRFQKSEAAGRVESNLQDVFVKTGVPPWEAARRAQTDPAWRQTVLGQDVNGDAVPPPGVRLPDPAPYGDIDPTKLRNVTPGVDGRPVPMNQRAPIPATPNIDHFMKIMPQVEGSNLPGADTAVSPKGAVGRFQITPGTARQYGFDPAKLTDPVYNTQVARAIAVDLYHRFNGDEELMLAAYNAGPGRANQLKVSGPGTRLVATPDPAVRGGVRYTQEASARNESDLPAETQKYLANSRRHAGGELPGSRGGASSGRLALPPPGGEGPPEGPGGVQLPGWMQPEEGGGGGRLPPPPEPPESKWSDMSTEDLYSAIKDSIGEENRAESLTTPTRLLSQFISELEPARKIDQMLMKEAPQFSRNKDMLAEDMFRQTYASDKRAGVFIKYGAVDPITLDIIKDSPSMLDAARAVQADGGNVGDWEAWMVARRAVQKESLGIKTGVDADAARALGGKKGEAAKYANGTRMFNEVGQSVLRYGQGSGFFSAEQVAAMIKDNETHISFRRVMGDDKTYAGGVGRSFKVKPGVKTMEGSDRLIDRPIFSSMDNWRLIIKLADRNRAIGHVIAQAQRGYLTDLGLEKLEYNPKATVSPQPGDPFEGYDENGIIDRTTAYAPILAERGNGSLGANQFMYYNKGVPELWQTRDENLARLMRGADSEGEADILSKTLQTVAAIQRAGIVDAPHFAVVNVLKDQITAFVFDPLHPPPFVTLFKGALHSFGTDDVFQDWVAKGGAGSALVDLDLKYLDNDMHRVFEETGAFDRLANAVRHPIQLAQIIGERLDAASRVQYMQQAKGKGIDPVKAATMGRKAYLDFAEKGTLGWVNTWAKWVPFFRPSMLGLKQLGESLYDPAAANPLAKPANTLLYASLGIVLPSIVLALLNTYQDDHDDSIPEARKYRNLPAWQKDMYFVSPEIEGVRFKLGMPQSEGVLFGGLANRFVAHFKESDPVRYGEWSSQVLKQLAVPMLPTALVAPLEHITNHDFFTGQTLIPASLDQKAGYMQYTEATSETAKKLSRVLAPRVGTGLADVSPVVIDNYVREFTGSLGMVALKALDIPYHAEKKPWELADIPFVTGFVTRNPGMSAEPIQRFYDAADDVIKAQGDLSLAKSRMMTRDNSQELQESLQDPLVVVKVQQFQKALSLQAELIRGINANKDMTRDEKRQQIEGLVGDMISEAKVGSSLVQSIRDNARPLNASSAPLPPQEAPQDGGQPPAPSGAPGPVKPIHAPPQAAPGSPDIGPPLTVGGR